MLHPKQAEEIIESVLNWVEAQEKSGKLHQTEPRESANEANQKELHKRKLDR